MIVRELLEKLRNGKITSDELDVLQSYLDNTENHEFIELLNEFWDQTDQVKEPEFLQSLKSSQKSVWLKLINEIDKSTGESIHADSESLDEKPRTKFLYRWQYVAASIGIFFALSIGWFLIKEYQIKDDLLTLIETRSGNWIEKRNETDKRISIKLQDGSHVILSPGGRILIPKKFDNDMREVRLTGEAFFSITRDSLHPFAVKTSSLVIRVLGTSFNVSEGKENSVTEVAVKSGKVMVESKTLNKNIYLLPNEKVTVETKVGNLVKTLVAKPEIVGPDSLVNKFDFNEAPVADVFQAIQAAYGVEIQFDKSLFANCHVNANLTDQPLFTKLDMICASLGANYRLDGTIIVVEGEGCNH